MKTVTLLALVCLLAACDRPEAERTRGGGPGADVGNRGTEVLMHEGSRPYSGTPRLAPGQPASTESANEADRLSRK